MITIAANSRTAATPAPARPKGKNLRWAMVGIITGLTIVSYLDRGNISVAVPFIEKDLGLSDTTMGVILSAFVWPYAIMNLPAGLAIDRFGPKLLMAIAATAWSIAGALTGLARGVAALVGLRILLGISEAPLFPAALRATNSWFPGHEKARAAGTYLAASQLGLAIAPPLATLLIKVVGWRPMFVIIGLIGLLAVLAWVRIYREPAAHPNLSREEQDYISAGQAQANANTRLRAAKIGFREWAHLFVYSSTWTIILGGFCLQYVFWFYITWLPTYLQRVQGFSMGKAGFLSSMPFIAGTVGVLLGGRLSDQLIVLGMSPFDARRYTLAGGALCTGLAMLATAVSSGPVLVVSLLTLGMFTYSLTSASHWTLAIDSLQTDRFVASMGSIQNFGSFVGGACAPIVTGIVVDRFGSFVIAIIGAGVMALLSAALYSLVLRRRLPI